MRKLPLTAAEDLLDIVMRRYERASTIDTTSSPFMICKAAQGLSLAPLYLILRRFKDVSFAGTSRNSKTKQGSQGCDGTSDHSLAFPTTTLMHSGHSYL